MLKHLVFLLPVAAMAADPAGFALWKSADLKSYEKKLSTKLDAQKIGGQSLGSFGNHKASISHREGPGIAELHVSVADIFVVETGEATLIIGGTIPDKKTTEPGEVRGPKIEGGTRHAIAAGDVVHIPANTPHQMLLDPGKQITYFVVKVDTK